MILASSISSSKKFFWFVWVMLQSQLALRKQTIFYFWPIYKHDNWVVKNIKQLNKFHYTLSNNLQYCLLTQREHEHTKTNIETNDTFNSLHKWNQPKKWFFRVNKFSYFTLHGKLMIYSTMPYSNRRKWKFSYFS